MGEENKSKNVWTVLETNGIETAVWNEDNVFGHDTLRFSLNRREDGRLQRSFKPVHLVDVCRALVKLARHFADSPNLDGKLRQKLRRLANVLEWAELVEAKSG